MNNKKTVYLSGPMDFSSNSKSWRTSITHILKILTNNYINILDPTISNKNYGSVENDKSYYKISYDTYFSDPKKYYNFHKDKTVSPDLNMVHDSDVVIAYSPNNTYSVGTMHEICYAWHLISTNPLKTLVLIHSVHAEQPYPSSWFIGLVQPEFLFDCWYQSSIEYHLPYEETDDLKKKNMDTKIMVNNFPYDHGKRDFLTWLLQNYKKYFL